VTTDDVRTSAGRRSASGTTARRAKRRAEPDTPLDRIVVQDVRPSTPHGRPAKAVVGELTPITANIFREGHDVLAARAQLRRGNEVVAVCALTNTGNDEWAGALTPRDIGAHDLVIQAWTDRYASWARKATIKLAARDDVRTEVAEVIALLSEASEDGKTPARPGQGELSHDGEQLARALAALSNSELDDASRINVALSAPVSRALHGPRLATDLTSAAPVPVWVDRERASVGAWYELFPRSFGGLRGAAAQVPRLAGLGFDVLYIPPVHPIGHTFRKGKNNSLVAQEGDPGSPWAIGSEEGGFTALHPDLGTLDDFDFLVRTVEEHGMELAMDYALNCSPDHPWPHEHPEWFHHRPDGSIAYAENPPKKYQDIYPINFWPREEADRVALWQACRAIIDFWSNRGIRIYRVDNPHTKPFAFWEWMIKALRQERPDVVLLAEAFTRPKIMARLAELGFSQSYTYFTWRVSQYGPEGIRTYVEELAHTGLADYMRPNFWPNTPDILSSPLRGGPPSAFALRYILAATLSPSYGVYSGYELCENVPASPDNEEYLNSEKYEIKHRDFARTGTLAPLFGAVNAIRRRHRAFASLRTVHFHGSDNPNVLAYSKTSDDGSDIVLVVVTLDPYTTQESTLSLDMPALVGQPATWLEVHDELSGETYTWGSHPYVRLDPWRRVAHVTAVRSHL
jgi:starch synthase (maltosyl-transferring)